MSKVSIVLLTNGKAELLREVLGSILGQEHKPIEVIVVVNGPHADIEAILAEFPVVLKIVNDRNLGFTVGMNQGLRAATGEYVYLTANDIVLAADYIGAMVAAARAAAPAWGLAGGVWRNCSSDAREVFAAGGSAHFGLGGMRMRVYTAVPETDQPYDVDWLPGAGVFASKALWDILGGFREEFFAHAEDIELCARVRQLGGYVRVVPAAVLYHHEHPNGLTRDHLIEGHKLSNYLAINALYGPLYALPWVWAKFLIYTAPRIAWHLRSLRFLVQAWWAALSRIPMWLVERSQRPGVALSGPRSTAKTILSTPRCPQELR